MSYNRLTLRKARNRGEPIRYRTADQVQHGWIETRGRKWMTVYLVGVGRRRVPLAEERYMVAL